MASSYPEENKSESFLFISETEMPHFFKIILDVQQPNLRIPKKFARRYANNLLSKAFLQVPNGPKWQVKLIKSDCFRNRLSDPCQWR
ncbi:hypothetical protein M5689_001700 [Euphorbia peplus]|nr:hypothetical protein M5689_001700 [Euphorbia peplus]